METNKIPKVMSFDSNITSCKAMLLLMVQKSFTSRYGKYPIIYRVLYIPGGAGFVPSTVSPETRTNNKALSGNTPERDPKS